MNPKTVVRLRDSGQLALVLDHIVGVGAGPDLAGDLRIPVKVIGTDDKLHLFALVDNLELVHDVGPH